MAMAKQLTNSEIARRLGDDLEAITDDGLDTGVDRRAARARADPAGGAQAM